MDEKETLLKAAVDSIRNYDEQEAENIARNWLDRGWDPVEVIEKGFAVGINDVGDQFARAEIYLPQMMLAADALAAAQKVVKDALKGRVLQKKGIVVIGTIQGDIHQLGKNLVAMLLSARGYEVIDLGGDVPPLTLIKKAKEVNADIIGASSLMTVTMAFLRDVPKLLDDLGERGKFKFIIGGGPITQAYAEDIGADGYAPNANSAVELVSKILAKGD